MALAAGIAAVRGHRAALLAPSVAAFRAYGQFAQQQQQDTAKPLVYASAALLAGAGAVVAASADAPPKAPAADPYARPTAPRALPSSITLYQYEVCPYCCKVRAFLDYHKLPYKVVEVNPLTKGELKWSPDYKKVPVVKLDDDVVVDSSAIMSRLATDVAAAPASSSGGGKARGATRGSAAELEEEVRWRKWVDERLVKVLTANIYRNWDESVESFKYITDQTGWSWGTREAARWAGAVMMWQIGKRMPAKYNIEGDLRQALYDTADDFVANGLRGRRFAGGAAPNLADLAAFGVIRAVKSTSAFKDLMAHSKLKPWFDAMEEAVGGPSRLP